MFLVAVLCPPILGFLFTFLSSMVVGSKMKFKVESISLYRLEMNGIRVEMNKGFKNMYTDIAKIKSIKMKFHLKEAFQSLL